jgi:hypothetical protein
MKKIFFLITVLFALFSFTEKTQAQTTTLYEPAIDTITNTESDTITYVFPSRNYDFLWSLEILTSISGTDSLNVKIEELANNNATLWVQVGTTDVLGATGSANRVSREAGTLYGTRQRLIVTGVGTQSTRYRVFGTFRRKD